MEGSVEYAQLSDTLAEVGTQVSAAEAHGMLSGMATAPGEPDKAAWIAQVLADTQPRGEAAKAMLTALVGLYDQTLKALDDAELDFQLLLPADSAPLDERARALGQWCSGFLVGVGLSGLKQDTPLAQEVSEALRDLGAISQVELEAAEDEDNESAYAELVEYVRVAAMVVGSSLRAPAPAKKASDKKLH
jgi:yecA family protein